jgi:hypothetical protein
MTGSATKQSIPRRRRYRLRRFAGKDKIAFPPATKQPDGQISKNLSIPRAKNIPLSPSGKSGA